MTNGLSPVRGFLVGIILGSLLGGGFYLGRVTAPSPEKALRGQRENKQFRVDPAHQGAPPVIGMNVKDATTFLLQEGYDVKAVGSGRVVSQSPPFGRSIGQGVEVEITGQRGQKVQKFKAD